MGYISKIYSEFSQRKRGKQTGNLKMGKSFIDWYFEPLCEFFYGKEELEEVEPIFPTSSVTNIFRPKSFDTYIGQKRAKDILKSYIEGTTARSKVFPHLLIHGKAGCGKSTLAEIVANELKVQYKTIIAGNVKSVYDIVVLLNQVGENGMLFIDEIHALDRTTCEMLYSLIEDFKFNGQPVPQFTLVGATTELGEIIADRRPFHDRFKIILELEDYSPPELSQIVEQYKNNIFPLDNLDKMCYTTISENARLTPRIGIRLLETTIYMGDVQKALQSFGIIKEGYTWRDLKMLKYITQNEKGVGLQGLSSYLGIPTKSLIYDIEPHLLSNDLIVRTARGRKITEKGRLKIQELEK